MVSIFSFFVVHYLNSYTVLPHSDSRYRHFFLFLIYRFPAKQNPLQACALVSNLQKYIL